MLLLLLGSLLCDNFLTNFEIFSRSTRLVMELDQPVH